jgi:predicted amidophosphoribosyltransferase
MCCGVGGDYQTIIEMLQTIYEGELQCSVCGQICADSEPVCPECGGSLRSPVEDLITKQEPMTQRQSST